MSTCQTDLLNTLCILENHDGLRTLARPTHFVPGEDKGYTWGSRVQFFQNATKYPGVASAMATHQHHRLNHKEDLVGVMCYVWDKYRNLQPHPRLVVVYAKNNRFSYGTVDKDAFFSGASEGTIIGYRFARPAYLGRPSEADCDMLAMQTERNGSTFPEPLHAIMQMLESMPHGQGYAGRSIHDISPISLIPKEEVTESSTPEVSKLGWDDIKGQDEAVQELREIIEIPEKYPAIYAAYRKKHSKGVMLYGPPGCGKTLLGRVLSHTLGSGEDGFRYIKGGELFNQYVGSEEKAIREIFEEASTYKKNTGKPKILFFDEADALFTARRDYTGSTSGYDFMASTVGAFLTELDGLDECGAFVMLSTNRPEAIDPAVLRDGRISRKIKIQRPTQEIATEILRKNFCNIPINDLDAVITAGIEALYATNKVHYVVETDDHGTIRICYHHQISGAMLAGIAERTINNAIRRDVAAEVDVASGVTVADIQLAVETAFKETQDLDLVWLIKEVLGSIEPVSIRSVHARVLKVKNETPEIRIKHSTDGGENAID